MITPHQRRNHTAIPVHRHDQDEEIYFLFEGEGLLTVDGEEAGQNVTKLSKLLNGHHVVEVRQRRMLGQEVLLRQEVDVVEEGTSLVVNCCSCRP